MTNENQNIKTFNFISQQVEIEVKDLSFIKDMPKLLGTPHKVSFYQLMWINEGVAHHKIDFRDIAVKPNEILVISPGQVCEFDVRSEYHGKMILFTDSFFSVSEVDTNFLYTSQILSLLNQNRVISICPLLMNNLMILLKEELDRNGNNFQVEISQSILRIILMEAERNINMHHPIGVNPIVQRFYNAVEKHFRENKKLEQYVNLLGIGEKALSNEVKKITGVTPKAYIDKRIILEAKRLLAYSSLSAKEICFSLGFDEPTNFNNFFRKHTAQTPIQFKESTKTL